MRSTGPRSQEGKTRSSQNSLRYAFLSAKLLLPEEDPKALSKIRERLRDHFKPVGPIEQILVERIVNVLWRLGRLHRIESALLAGGFDDTEIVVTTPAMPEQPSVRPTLDAAGREGGHVDAASARRARSAGELHFGSSRARTNSSSRRLRRVWLPSMQQSLS